MLSVGGFMALEGIQSLGLVNLLSLVGEQHRITVKGNPHFSRVRLTGVG
jgi:hypothetical protein